MGSWKEQLPSHPPREYSECSIGRQSKQDKPPGPRCYSQRDKLSSGGNLLHRADNQVISTSGRLRTDVYDHEACCPNSPAHSLVAGRVSSDASQHRGHVATPRTRGTSTGWCALQMPRSSLITAHITNIETQTMVVRAGGGQDQSPPLHCVHLGPLWSGHFTTRQGHLHQHCRAILVGSGPHAGHISMSQKKSSAGGGSFPKVREGRS